MTNRSLVTSDRSGRYQPLNIVHGKTHIKNMNQLQLDHSVLFGSHDNLCLALCLHFLVSLKNSSWMEPINSWLEFESRARLGLFVARIQRLIRRKLGKNLQSKQRQKNDVMRQQLTYDKTVLMVQSLIRKYLARIIVMKLAQRIFIRYITPDGKYYWYNPNTRRSTWTKPLILGKYECISIPLPPTGLEIQVRCIFCNIPAEVNCTECQDSMCRSCYNSFHHKGKRKDHHKENIPFCSYCKYQVATKFCKTCLMVRPKIISYQHTLKESVRAMYCDYCFVSTHDQDTETAISRRKQNELQILNHSNDAYLIRHILHQRINTNHHYDDIVKTCEECEWRCASWRCHDCAQVYCHTCLVGLHSLGGPFGSHKADVLPFYTHSMHRSYLSDETDQRLQRKADYVRKKHFVCSLSDRSCVGLWA
jgi:hypothetical protein